MMSSYRYLSCEMINLLSLERKIETRLGLGSEWNTPELIKNLTAYLEETRVKIAQCRTRS